NADAYAIGVPGDVLERLELFDLSYDFRGEPVDWSPVRERIAAWTENFNRHPRPLLTYSDGVDFLLIEDRRFGGLRPGSYAGLERDIYLACLEIRTVSELRRAAAARGVTAPALDSLLSRFVEDRIMFREGDRYLSLAVATEPHIAARRIRQGERIIEDR